MAVIRMREEILELPEFNNTHKKNCGVVVIGGANIDFKGRPYEKLIRKTSNPGEVNVNFGGVSRNIAHNLALLGVPVTLLSAVGDDEWGRKLLEETGKGGGKGRAGVQINNVIKSSKVQTGMYLVILNEKGEMNVAISDMQVLEEITVKYLKSKENIIKNSKIVVIDTNISERSIKYISEVCKREKIMLVADPVSVEKAKKLRKVIDKIDCITPNKEELASISGIKIENDKDMVKGVKTLRDKGVKNIVLTLGKRGVYISTAGMGREKGKFIPPHKVEVIDVTGVGDALVAGLVYGIFKGDSLEIAVRYGLVAAAVTISSPYTVNPGMKAEILERMID